MECLKNDEEINNPSSTIRPFKCSLCDLVFDRISQLDNHKRSVHNKERSKICQICGKGFFRGTDLKTHLNIHLGTNRCVCEICGKKFNHVSNFIRHGRTHSGVKPYPCTICGKRFTQINTLARHKAIHVRGDETCDCSFCDKKYKTRNGLKEHMKKLHGFTESSSKDRDKIIRRKHYCKICGESFQFVELLRSHENIHSMKIKNVGIKDCEICYQKFENFQDIEDHRCKKFNNQIDYSVKLKYESTMNEEDESLLKFNLSKRNDNDNFINDDKKLSFKSVSLVNERKIINDNETKETIVYLRAEQLGNLNADQLVIDTANHYLHEHLLELTNDNETDGTVININVENGDDETVVSEMIKNCWKDIEMPDNNGTVIRLLNNDNCDKNIDEEKEAEDNNLCLIKENETNINEEEEKEEGGDDKILGNNIESIKKYSKKNFKEFERKFNIIQSLKLVDDKIIEKEEEKENLTKNDDEEIENHNNNNIEDILKSSQMICRKKNIENQEPILRLVQTENGEEFYELLITANVSERIETDMKNINDVINEDDGEGGESMLKLVEFDETRENKNDKIIYYAQNNSRDCLVDLFESEELCDTENNSFNKITEEFIKQNFDNGTENDRNDVNLNDNCDDIFCGIEEKSLNNDNKFYEKSKIDNGPMVRLVQNEDGAQFFELIRGDLEEEEEEEEEEGEQEEIQDFGLIKNNKSYNRKLKYDSDDKIIGENFLSDSLLKIDKEIVDKRKPTTNKNLGVESSSAARKKRLKNSNDKKYNCEVCKKSFSKGYNYRQHIGTHFVDQQKFKCKECGQLFAWKSTLNKHVAGHKAGGQQKFVCKICPKVYTTLSQVNEHVKRDHLKERNHECPHCAKTFFKKFDLKIHIRTHTKERPYECRVCYKSFHHQSHIIRHERIHSGEKPYACNICDKTFTQLGSLKNHRQRHKELKIDILDYQMDEDDPLPQTML